MDESTFSDESRTFDLPDGLVQFRMNLVELLVDICQLLQPATFVQKVLILYNNPSLYGFPGLIFVPVDDISCVKMKIIFVGLILFYASSSVCFVYWSSSIYYHDH